MPAPARSLPARSATWAVALLAAVLLLTSCGSSDDGGSASTGATAGPGGAGGGTGPVTVGHLYGSTTVEERPARIVSLDTQWTDVLLAMGEAPVGFVVDANAPEGLPWRGDELAGATPIQASTSIPVEQVAALQPDLIVASWQIEDAGTYEQLSQIAPTIPLLDDRQVDPWQDMVEVAGQVLAEPDQAATVQADVEAAVQAAAEAHPGLEGKTFALANYVPGDSIYVVADPDDGSMALFEDLGLSISPTILDAAGGATGRFQLSLENVSMLDGDLLVLFTNGADPTSIPGYDQLPAVRSGAVLVLDYADVLGLNTPTPLSIPYELELLEPALTAAER